MQTVKKSVCVVAQSHYNNDPRVKRKAQALVAAGYSVDVLALRGPKEKKAYISDGVNVETFALGKERGSLLRYAFEYAAFSIWACVRVTLRTRKRRYSVIDINTLPDFLVFCGMFARLMGAKLVLDMHEITPEFYMSKYGMRESSWKVRLIKFLERISFGFADHVITISDPVKDLLVRRGLKESKSTVITNSADESRFANTTHKEPIKSGDSGKRFVMMYHGTLTRIYGLDLAVEAFALVHRQMPGAELWILGAGPETEVLIQLKEKYDLDAKVKLLGLVAPSSIPEWLGQCDVGVLPIRRDAFLDFAFPNKLPEFIIMGKPVIVSRLGAIGHYFSDDSVAYFTPNDPQDLSRVMLQMYEHPEVRPRLAAQAAAEYRPICWNVMRGRYLDLMLELVGGRSGIGVQTGNKSDDAHEETVDVAPYRKPASASTERFARQLLEHCYRNNWAGYDPYDALNSIIFERFPALKTKLVSIVITQTLKRSPINLRALLWIPKTQNPKALALFISGLVRAPQLAPNSQPKLIQQMTDILLEKRSQGTDNWCWGYSFPWQGRNVLVPRGAPNLVCTYFAATAMLDLYEESRIPQYLEIALSASDYLLNELYWSTDSASGFSYPTPSMKNSIHNANLLAAELLCRVHNYSGEGRFLEPALKAARYSAGRQSAHGSWAYGELPTQQWIDNFHTGYNLCALRAIGIYANTDEFDGQVRRGFKFYCDHFFRNDGAPRYFHNQTYPIDVHCVAQSIITLLQLQDLNSDSRQLANAVFSWASEHMWSGRGFFFYRVLKLGTIKTDYMRWSQAWMFRALCELLHDRQREAPTSVKTQREVLQIC